MACKNNCSNCTCGGAPEYLKKEDVLNLILESTDMGVLFKRVKELPSEDVVGVSVIEKHMDALREERDKYEFRTHNWERLDDTIDSIEWAVGIWKSGGKEENGDHV